MRNMTTPYVEIGVATVPKMPPGHGASPGCRRHVSVDGLNSYQVLLKKTRCRPLFGSVVTTDHVIPVCCGLLPSRVIWRCSFMRKIAVVPEVSPPPKIIVLKTGLYSAKLW